MPSLHMYRSPIVLTEWNSVLRPARPLEFWTEWYSNFSRKYGSADDSRDQGVFFRVRGIPGGPKLTYREAKPVLIPEFFELDVRRIREEKLANSRRLGAREPASDDRRRCQ